MDSCANASKSLTYILPCEREYSKKIDLQKLNRTNSWKVDIATKQKQLSENLIDKRDELSSCPMCDSEKFSLFVEVFKYNYVVCNECNHIFCKNPVNTEAIKKLYSDTDASQKAIQGEIYINDDLFKVRVKSITQPKVDFVSETVSRKGLWVDLGAGVGELVQAAISRGWKAIGYESDPAEVAYAHKLCLPVKKLLLNESNIKNVVANAEVVSLINVLEHIREPIPFVKSISDSMAEDAYFVLEIPRHPSLSSLSNKLFPDLACRHIYPPDHLHIFSEKSVAIMLNKCNLVAVKLWLFSQDYYELISSLSIYHAIPENDYIFSKLFSIANEMQSQIDKENLSDIMFIITKKTRSKVHNPPSTF